MKGLGHFSQVCRPKDGRVFIETFKFRHCHFISVSPVCSVQLLDTQVTRQFMLQIGVF